MDKLVRHSPLGSAPGIPKIFATGEIALLEEPFLAMIKLTVRNLTADDFSKIGSVVDAPITGASGEVVAGKITAAWMSPEEWLFLGDDANIEAAQRGLIDLFRNRTALIWPLTDARASISLEGDSAPDILSSLCPMDFSAGAFPFNRCVRTILGETGAFIHKIDDGPAFRIIVDPSYGEYAWRMLEDACGNIAEQSV